MQGEHRINIDHTAFGPTCGLLPVGIDSTNLTTTGLRWNLSTSHVYHTATVTSYSLTAFSESPILLRRPGLNIQSSPARRASRHRQDHEAHLVDDGAQAPDSAFQTQC